MFSYQFTVISFQFSVELDYELLTINQ